MANGRQNDVKKTVCRKHGTTEKHLQESLMGNEEGPVAYWSYSVASTQSAKYYKKGLTPSGDFPGSFFVLLC